MRSGFILGRRLGHLRKFMDAHIHEDPRFPGNGLDAVHKLIGTAGESKRARKLWDIYCGSDTNSDTSSVGMLNNIQTERGLLLAKYPRTNLTLQARTP
jgi:hypothetical protein